VIISPLYCKILRGVKIAEIKALAKNFPKVANFWKVGLRCIAILPKNAQNTEGCQNRL
jgi:hypothetical protein